MEFRTTFLSVILNGADPELYNCSSKNIEEWYETGSADPVIGVYFMVSGVILEMLYIPCLIVMGGHEMIHASCFKIMMYLGVLDVISLLINSIATGYFAFIGAVYCTHPTIMLTLGAIGCACWCGACMNCVLLALNRCADMGTSRFMKSMFQGNNVWILLGLPTLYLFSEMFLTSPASFNSVYVSWFFNPMTGGDPLLYQNPVHAINNCVVSICTTVLYFYICTKLFLSSRMVSNFGRIQKQVFIQAFLICLFNAIAAYIYVYMQYFPVSQWVVLMGQVAWQYSCGSVCIIYLLFNRSIRHGVFRMIIPKYAASLFKINIATTSVVVLPTNHNQSSSKGHNSSSKQQCSTLSYSQKQ